uniref:Uncharacterized protein n=1 Tax=Myoviridae sp. ctTBm11 TaxID=2825108 RepID=A0A8S5PP47_9CAUD|nr:MAG TPA: hypothetical protein [Myoviridae sp. ctTBm11]
MTVFSLPPFALLNMYVTFFGCICLSGPIDKEPL